MKKSLLALVCASVLSGCGGCGETVAPDGPPDEPVTRESGWPEDLPDYMGWPEDFPDYMGWPEDLPNYMGWPEESPSLGWPDVDSEGGDPEEILIRS